jgi:hypothetical protein
MAGKKMKLEEKAIREILVADTDSESGAEVSDVEEYFEEEERNNNNNSKPHQNSNHRLQQVADYQPGDRPKEGTQIFILLSVQQKV